MRGRNDVLSFYKKRLKKGGGDTSILYVEGLIESASWPGSNRSENAPPAEFKFFTFGSKVATVMIVIPSSSKHECRLWVDENFKRQDQYGCTWYNPTKQKNIAGAAELGKKITWTKCANIPKPPNWSKLVSVARRLGGALGVHYRIDLYDSNQGVLLKKFTAFHSQARCQCVITRNDSGVLDPCHLGRLWAQDGHDGSLRSIIHTRNIKPPEVVDRYISMASWNLREIPSSLSRPYLCELVMLNF